MPHEESRKEVGLPVRPFLYTLDQIAGLLSMSKDTLHRLVIYYEGRSVHRRTPEDLQFINLAKRGVKPEVWRCSEEEFIRWMRFKGFKVRDSSWARK